MSYQIKLSPSGSAELTIQLSAEFVKDINRLVDITNPNAMPGIEHGLFGWNPYLRKDRYVLEGDDGRETVEAFGHLHAIAIGFKKFGSFDMAESPDGE